MFGDPELKKKIYLKGKEWATGKDDRRIARIAGWAILAASANTEEERAEAYGIVMGKMDTPHIDMAANVKIAAAILANEAQKQELYRMSSEEHEKTQYWDIHGGALIAMAITAPTGEERSKIYQIANERLKKGYNHRYTKKDMLVMALTAQTEEEKNKAFKLAEEYSDTKKYHNFVNGWANISLGILGSKDRDLAIKSVAALIEQND